MDMTFSEIQFCERAMSWLVWVIDETAHIDNWLDNATMNNARFTQNSPVEFGGEKPFRTDRWTQPHQTPLGGILLHLQVMPNRLTAVKCFASIMLLWLNGTKFCVNVPASVARLSQRSRGSSRSNDAQQQWGPTQFYSNLLLLSCSWSGNYVYVNISFLCVQSDCHYSCVVYTNHVQVTKPRQAVSRA